MTYTGENGRQMLKPNDWRVVNDSPVWLKPRRTVYYLSRTVNGKREDLEDKAGRLRTWRTREQAQAALSRLLKAGE